MIDLDTQAQQLPIRVRPGITAGSRYTPGARGLPPGANGARIVRLASNELAFGPLPGVLESLGDGESVVRYPDSSAVALRERIAQHLGVEPTQVAVGNGSVGLIEQIYRLVLGTDDELLMGSLSFDAYATLAQPAGAAVVRVPLAGAGLDLGAMSQAVSDRTRVIFVCTPNNPTGGTVAASALKDFLAQLPKDILVVVDEAYREFVDDPDAANGLDLIGEHDNVLSLRTFSKAYGLAGLRLGYCIGQPVVIDALNAMQAPFSVNAPAQRAAMISLGCTEQLAERVRTVTSERTRVRAELTGLGIDVPASQGNFLWLPMGQSAAAISSGLARAGVLVRPYTDQGIRVTIGSPEENDLFLTELARTLRPH